MKKIITVILICFSTTLTFAKTEVQTSEKQVVKKQKNDVKIVAHSVINFTELAKKEAARKKTPADTNIKTRVVPIGKYHERQIPPEDLEKIKNGKQFNKAVPEKKSSTSDEPISSTSSNSSSDDEITQDNPLIPLGPVDTQNSFLEWSWNPKVFNPKIFPILSHPFWW